jgi:hypothetical protein
MAWTKEVAHDELLKPWEIPVEEFQKRIAEILSFLDENEKDRRLKEELKILLEKVPEYIRKREWSVIKKSWEYILAFCNLIQTWDQVIQAKSQKYFGIANIR